MNSEYFIPPCIEAACGVASSYQSNTSKHQRVSINGTSINRTVYRIHSETTLDGRAHRRMYYEHLKRVTSRVQFPILRTDHVVPRLYSYLQSLPEQPPSERRAMMNQQATQLSPVPLSSRTTQ